LNEKETLRTETRQKREREKQKRRGTQLLKKIDVSLQKDRETIEGGGELKIFGHATGEKETQGS